MIRTLAFLALTFSFLTTGCATSFTGSAHFPGGPLGCAATCERDGMTMGAFVHAGEYSTACVCEPRKVGVDAKLGGLGGIGATSAAAVGVVLQARAAQQQQAFVAH